MSPSKKTKKKVTRKAATKKASKAGAKKKATSTRTRKKAAAQKTPRKAARKTTRKDAKKAAPEKPPPAAPAARPAKAAAARRAKSARRGPETTRGQAKHGVAQPIESAERKPQLGAKWACFNCGAKFYDLNRPDPICPKCQTDQRDQPAKAPSVPSPPPKKRPAVPPITRLLDEEEAPDDSFDDESGADAPGELDIGKLDGDVDYLDDAEFAEEGED